MRIPRRAKLFARLAVAVSPLLICLNADIPPGGCQHTGEVPRNLSVQLPLAPSFMAPTAEPKVVAGDDAVIAFRKTRTALRVANARLSNSRGWYGDVRKRYSGR